MSSTNGRRKKRLDLAVETLFRANADGQLAMFDAPVGIVVAGRADLVEAERQRQVEIKRARKQREKKAEASERIVLSAALRKPAWAARAVALIGVDDFRDPFLAAVFGAVAVMHTRNAPLDVEGIMRELRNQGVLLFNKGGELAALWKVCPDKFSDVKVDKCILDMRQANTTNNR